ncbi:unnamed protein product [Chironomus riparius]|uniref:C-type lectin domain-containing protein n=1 Tax=Chironomus riparius TaxID=315576 RepID=A0A9N9RWS0_9DIPT|nr:unnamed protein product [Chironomus riparius]
MQKAAQIFLTCLILCSCKTILTLSMIEKQADSIIVEDVAFIKLGTYRGFTDAGVEYQKTFLLQRYSSAPWAESKAICKAFDLDLVSFETLVESRAFLNMLDTNSALRTLASISVWSDGITLSSIGSTTDWYWSKTGKKISFSIDWLPNQPNGNNDQQYCMCIARHDFSSTLKFNDCFCYGAYRIACQRTQFFLS